MSAGIIMLMTAQGFRVASIFLKRNGDRAVVNVNQHDGGYLESLISFNAIKMIVTYV